MAELILLVEDDPVTATLGRRALERAGYEVVHVATAEACGTAMSEHDVDLVIMDLFLPDGDGLAICRQIRQVHDLPVLMVSALEADLGEPLVGPELGPQAFLSKPVRPEDLVRQVTAMLAGEA